MHTTTTTTKEDIMHTMSSSFISTASISDSNSIRASFSSSIETISSRSFRNSTESTDTPYKLELELGSDDFSLTDLTKSLPLLSAPSSQDSAVPIVGCVSAGWRLDPNNTSSAASVILPTPNALVPSITSNTEFMPLQEYIDQPAFSSPGLLPHITISSSPILISDTKQLQARAEEIKRLEQAKRQAESTALAFNQTVKDIMTNNNNYKKKSPVISLRSFDSNQLENIPSPILNAISFSPRSAVIVSSEDDDIGFSDMDSIFSADIIESPAYTLHSQTEHYNPKHKILDKNENEEEDFEHGRLFVRVEKISDLTLPIPSSNQSPRIKMTLNNCKQSVSIDPIPLISTDIDIGQEFELVVGKQDFDINLLFRAEMREVPLPRGTPVETAAMAAEAYKHSKTSSTVLSPELPVSSTLPKKQSRLRTIFKSTSNASLKGVGNSPPKLKRSVSISLKSPHHVPNRKVDSKATPITVIPNSPPRVRKLWDGLTGTSGEFAQAVISYKATAFQQPYHAAFGRPASISLPLMNEWAYNQPHPTVATRVPVEAFAMGQLQVTLMFVPGNEFVPDLYYPDSIADAVTQYAEYLERAQCNDLAAGATFSGYLTQEGGGCRYWRRRWFELHGTTLIGHTDDTKKVRMVIELSSSTLLTGSLSHYDDDGCPFNKDKLFRLQVTPGKKTVTDDEEEEAIKFVADDTRQRDAWVRALDAAISNSQALARSWVGTVVEANVSTVTV